jgi:hypothetical protein
MEIINTRPSDRSSDIFRRNGNLYAEVWLNAAKNVIRIKRRVLANPPTIGLGNNQFTSR